MADVGIAFHTRTVTNEEQGVQSGYLSECTTTVAERHAYSASNSTQLGVNLLAVYRFNDMHLHLT